MRRRHIFLEPLPVLCGDRREAQRQRIFLSEDRSSSVVVPQFFSACSTAGRAVGEILAAAWLHVGCWTDQTLAHPTTPWGISQAMLAARGRASVGAGGTSSHASRRDVTPERPHMHGGARCRHLRVCPTPLILRATLDPHIETEPSLQPSEGGRIAFFVSLDLHWREPHSAQRDTKGFWYTLSHAPPGKT